MKKFTIVLCLMLLSMAIFSSRVYAIFITDIDKFVQYDGSDTFPDTFGDTFEPPSGPFSGTDYSVVGLGAFDITRESGGLLELNSLDEVIVGDEKIIGALVRDSTYFFNSGTAGQYVAGWFDFSGGGLPLDYSVNIGIFNAASADLGFSDNDDEAWLEIYQDANGDIYAEWGDESDNPLGSLNITSSVVDDKIGLKLEIDGSNNVTALLDYNYDETFETTLDEDFTALTFTETTNGQLDIYTGEFDAYTPVPSTISIDIKPQSCPNPLNVKSKGVLPVAILGTADLDVRDIDIATLEINGVAPVKSALDDVATTGFEPCDCLALGGDGSEDLILKFNTQAIVATLGSVSKGLEIPLTLTGNLLESAGGTAIEGIDCVVIKGVK